MDFIPIPTCPEAHSPILARLYSISRLPEEDLDSDIAQIHHDLHGV